MSKTASFDFKDLTVTEIPVNNLLGKNYVLREASGAAAARYRSQQVEATRFSDDGKPVGFDRGIVESEATLVGACLFEVVNGTVKAQPVGVGVVNSFPADVVKQLYNTCREISKLDTDTVETLKQQREAIDKRLDELDRGEGGDNAKNLSLITPAGSDSPQN